jgi:hypothetical protein
MGIKCGICNVISFATMHTLGIVITAAKLV